MGFFDKIGDGIKSVLTAPAKVLESTVKAGTDIVGNIFGGGAQGTGYSSGGFQFGSGQTGGVGAFLERSGGLITIGLVIVGIWLLASTLKKKKVVRRRRVRK